MPNNDEFKTVRKGLPSESTTQQAKFNFLGLFIVVGIVLGIFVLLFGDTINSIGSQLLQVGYTGVEASCGAILSLLVGAIQASIFKARIKSRSNLFVIFAVLGGLAGGLLGGILRDTGINSSIIIGAIVGGVAGGLSSLLQNGIMHNSKYSSKWFVFSLISWAIIYGIGWTISWGIGGTIGLASAAVFLMVGSGIALVSFLSQNPQIEFS